MDSIGSAITSPPTEYDDGMTAPPKHRSSTGMRAFALLTIGSAVALFSSAFEASPCTCSVPPIAQAVAQAESAFVGTVNSIGLDADKEKRVVTFTVQRVFKGSVPVQVQVVTPSSEGACGYSFAAGSVYLVFTRNIQGKRLTHLCSGNASASPRGPWPRELESGWTPK
jgi:hypothetical protein